MAKEHFNAGRSAFNALLTSCHISFIDPINVKPEDAARVFLPALKEVASMMSTPWPKDRKDWLDGFRQRRREYIKELTTEKPHEADASS